MRADGSGAMRLAQGGSSYGAVWAPDGRSVAYRREPAQNPTSEIALLSPGATEQIALFTEQRASFGLSLYHRSDGPTWSPDGQLIAFASRKGANALAIWVIPSAGGEPQRAMPELNFPHFHPSWALHDGARMAYVATQDGIQDLFVANLNEPMPHENLTRGRVHQPRSPRWSPDGQRIAFSADPTDAAENVEEVYVFDFAVAELLRVTDDNARAVGPAWAPDGTSLVIASSRETPEPDADAPSVQLWQVWLDGSSPPLRLTPFTGVSFGPDWYRSTLCVESP